MAEFIKDGELTATDYQVVADDAGESTRHPIITLEQFLALTHKPNEIGVWLEADEEVESIESYLAELPVVALNFPAFNDGRAYSSANILRRKFGYQGEIRAIGDVRADQLEQMVRCGFDAFELNEDQNTELALSKLNGFSYSYQHTVDREPLFRVRA